MTRASRMAEALHLCAVARGSMVVAMNALKAGLHDFAAASAREGCVAATEAAAICATLGDVSVGIKQLAGDTAIHSLRPAGMALKSHGAPVNG